MDKTIENQLKDLEKCFQENGYTKDMIEEIKNSNGAVTASDFIDNLQAEQSYWDC